MIVEKVVARWTLAGGRYFLGVLEDRLKYLRGEGREIISVSHAFIPPGQYCSAIIVASGERTSDEQEIHEKSLANLRRFVSFHHQGG